MKMTKILNYSQEDVFEVFIKHAAADFKKFDRENPIGSKIEKQITTGGPKPIKVSIEITDYKDNFLYEITTSNPYSECITRYSFAGQKDGGTKVTVFEKQKTKKFVQQCTLYLQRFFYWKRFRASCKGFFEALDDGCLVRNKNRDKYKNDAKRAEAKKAAGNN